MKTRGKGFALVTVLFVLAILFIFCATLFQMTAFQQTRQQADWKLQQAKAIADAGLTKAALYLEENGLKELPNESAAEKGYSFKENYSGGTFTVNFEYLPVSKRINSLPWKITSTGRFQGRKADSITIADGYDPLRKIVVFAKGSPQIMWKEIGSRHGTVLKTIPLINAAIVVLNSSSGKSQLIMETGVVGVDNDARAAAMMIDRLARKKIGSVGKNNNTTMSPYPWGINRINAPSAWGKSTGLNVKVAIIDTGIITNHPILKLSGGINIIDPTLTYVDDNGHGTHVAGTIAAINDLNGGVTGGAHQASIFAVKVLDKNGSGYVSDLISGLNWALNNGIKVANLSLGTTTDVTSLHDAIINVTNAGMIIVAGAGNNYGGAVLYPAKYSEAIAVAASTESDTIANFSSIGPEVDFIAPGTNIFSTYTGQCITRKSCTWYYWMSGTSMATPHVTAAAALRVFQTPTATPLQIKEALKSSSTLLPGLTTDQQGSGLVNAYTLVNIPTI